MMTAKEARVLVSGRMQFGNPDHIEAVVLLETLSEAREAGLVDTYWIRQGLSLLRVEQVMMPLGCRSCGGGGSCSCCGEECPDCNATGKRKVVSIDALTKEDLVELLAMVSRDEAEGM